MKPSQDHILEGNWMPGTGAQERDLGSIYMN